MASLLLLLFLLALFTPLTPASKQAELLDCRAARKSSIEQGSLSEFWRSFDTSRKSDNWTGEELAQGRHIWTALRGWKVFRDAYSHCLDACLHPAASWGFDAAYCRLWTPRDARVAVGYSPSNEYKCSKYSTICASEEARRMYPTGRLLKNCHLDVKGPCYDDIKRAPWDDERTRWALQNVTGGWADLKDIWIQTKSGNWVPREMAKLANSTYIVGNTSFPATDVEVTIQDGLPEEAKMVSCGGPGVPMPGESYEAGDCVREHSVVIDGVMGDGKKGVPDFMVCKGKRFIFQECHWYEG